MTSAEFQKELQRVHKQAQTGYLSVTGEAGLKRTYGTLHIRKGELIKAEYGNLTGRAAVDMMSSLASPIISFAPSSISGEADAGLPNMATLAGSEGPKGAPRASGSGFKIFPQVLLTMFFVALVPLAGLWYINNVRISQTVQEDVEANLSKTSDMIVSQVNDWTDKNARSSRQVANALDMATLTPNAEHPLLIAAANTNEWNYSAFVVDPTGQVVARNDGKDLLNYQDREYVQQILQGQPVGQQVVISRINGRPSLCMSVPVERAGAVAGLVAQCGTLDEVSNFVATTKVGETGVVFVTDATGKLIAHTNPALVGEELQDYSGDQALAAALNQPVVVEEGGKQVVNFSRKTDLGWTVVVQQDYAEAFAPLREAQRNALLILVATVLFVIIVASLMARRLVKPIESLTEAAENMSRGQLGAEIRETERGDEIGSLARAVERMGVSIKMAFEELTTSQGAR